MDRFGGRCACALVALFIALPAYATGGTSVITPTVRAVQTEFTRLMSQPARLGQMVKFSEDFGPTRPLRYVSKMVRYTPSSVGGLAKSLIRGGAPLLLINGVIQGAGWVISELEGQLEVVEPGSPAHDCDDGWALWTAGSINVYCSRDDALAAYQREAEKGYASPSWSAGTWTYVRRDHQKDESGVTRDGDLYLWEGEIYYETSFGDPRTSERTPNFFNYDSVVGEEPAVEPRIIGDEELGSKITSNQLSWPDLLNDPVTGRPRETQEILDAIDELRRQAVADQGGDPAAVPGQGPSSGDGGVPSGPPDSEPFIPPSLPPDSAVPFSDVGEVKSWSSGIGSSAACPEPFSIPLWDGNALTISWQPLCTGADYLRPLLIGFGYLSAVYILLGMRRGGA